MKKAILLASYGAATAKGQAALRSFEEKARKKYAGWTIRWAFTSDLLRLRLESSRQKSDSLHKALLRLNYEGFERVAIQPLHLIPGAEYSQAVKAMQEAAGKTGACYAMGQPLLTGIANGRELATALLASLPEERRPDEDVVFMGHGAKHEAAALYGDLGRELASLDIRVHVGIMRGHPALADVVPCLASRRVWLLPLLSIIGSHALRDMAGSGPGSWKSRIERQGHICSPVLQGLVESSEVASLWLRLLDATATRLTSEEFVP